MLQLFTLALHALDTTKLYLGQWLYTLEPEQSDTWVFRHPVTSDKNVWSQISLLTKIKPEYSDILYNPTHFPGPLVCQIRQVPLYKQNFILVSDYKKKNLSSQCNYTAQIKQVHDTYIYI
jgi:hypothetical protein